MTQEACSDCGHDWSAHQYDRNGNELPDGGPCYICGCKGFQ